MFEYADHTPAINNTIETHYCQLLTFTVLHLSKLDGVARLIADPLGCNSTIRKDATPSLYIAETFGPNIGFEEEKIVFGCPLST